MSAGRSIVIILGLSVLLTWLSWRAINPQAELFDQALSELEHFGLIQNALYRDVFTVRTGLLRNYDRLVTEIDASHGAVARLRTSASFNSATSERVDRLAASVEQQEQLIEVFKRQNAALHNSLSFFSRLGVNADLRELDIEIGAASAAILYLTLDTSSSAVNEAAKRLDRLETQAARTGHTAEVEPFLAHGRLLQRLLPSIDTILKEMMTLPRKVDQDQLRDMILVRQLASRKEARLYRTLLYIASLSLVAFLVHLGIRLRSRTNALKRRADLEHLLLEISMNFINAMPERIDVEIERAVALFAERIGCDRAYLLVSGSTRHSYLWQRPRRDFPAGWPDTAAHLAVQMGAEQDGAVHVAHVSRLPAGLNKSTLDGVGISGWACAMSIDRQGRLIALGVDVIGQDCHLFEVGELVLLRMALDTFIHATNRRSIEEERVRLRRRLQQSARMEVIGTFASGIAHNFNNILGGILGHTEVMEELARGAAIESHVGGIRRSAERARDLISQILAFGRCREIRRNPISIAELVKETIALLRVSLPSRVELVIVDCPDSVTVDGEGAQLQQVLTNLCHNAANAIAHAGRIEVVMELCKELEGISLSHDKIESGQYVRISVIDTGKGMEAAVLDRLFEPFFTTRPEGNGLGLATAREIVRDHGGGINVQSRQGEGSRFDVWLPLATAVQPAEPDLAAHPLGAGEVVMLVATDSDRLLGDEERLAALGYEAVGYMTAEAAREAVEVSPGRFDFVILGQLGSLTKSLELATDLHRSLPSIPIVLATRGSSEIGAETLVAAGIADVVRWPIVVEEIATALSQFSKKGESTSSVWSQTATFESSSRATAE
ncbi:signal transduction histidine kinase/CheY-like chemotaxis protein [Bradyrhizobium sp. RT4a]